MPSIAVPVIAFLFISFIIGIYSSGLVAGKIRNFYVAGNIIPIWVIAMSQTGQAIEIGGTYDNASLVMSGSIIEGLVLPFGIGVSLILIGLFYAEKLHKMKLLTLADFYGIKFGKIVELLVSIILVSSFIILIASNLVGVGLVVDFAITGLNKDISIIIIATMIMIYTMAGGLFAVTWNDVLHVGVMFIALAAVLIYLISLQDLSTFGTSLKSSFHVNEITSIEHKGLKNWSYFLALALGDIVALDFMERVFAAKTPKFAKISCLIAGGFVIVAGLIMGFIGVLASMHIGDVPADEKFKFLWFIKNDLPIALSMIMFLGLISACISTIDGSIMACTAVITKNVMQSNFPNLIPKNKLLFFSRMTAIPVTVIAVIISMKTEDPVTLLLFAFDLVFASCLVPLTLGLYLKRVSKNGALVSVIVSVIARITLHFVFGGSRYDGLQTLLPPIISLFVYLTIWLLESKNVQTVK